MKGYVRLDTTDAEWWPAIVQPSPFGGYDAVIGDQMYCGISVDNVRITEEE